MSAKQRHVAPQRDISKITKEVLLYPDDIPDTPEVVAQKISEKLRVVVKVSDVKKVALWNDKTWPHERRIAAARASKRTKIQRLGSGINDNHNGDLSKNRVRYLAAVLCQLVSNLNKLHPAADALLDGKHIELLLMLRNNITVTPEMYGTVGASVPGTAQAQAPTQATAPATSPAQAYSPPANGTGSLFH